MVQYRMKSAGLPIVKGQFRDKLNLQKDIYTHIWGPKRFIQEKA